MITIQNKAIAITCDESGHGLTIIDQRRGTHWMLDEKTMIYGSTADPIRPEWTADGTRQCCMPVGACKTGDDTVVISWKAGPVILDIAYVLGKDYVEVRLPTTPCGEIKAISLPGSFYPVSEPLRLLLPIMQGMLWDGRGPTCSLVRPEAGHLGFSMSFIGYLGASGGLLVTPITRDDQVWWYGKDAQGRFWATNVQIASLGTMRYERSLRVCPLDADIVAIAKRYRQKIKDDGRFVSWQEKIAARPGLERLFGALMCFVGYCQDGLDYVVECRKLQAYGFDRALVYPVRFNMFYPDIKMGGQPAIDLNPQVVAGIKALGYDVAPWSWLNEALDVVSHHPEQSVRRLYRKNAQGETMAGWKIDDQQWYLTCYALLEEYQKAALAGRMADMTWDHFDVLACVSGLECYALDHPAHLGRPLTRSENREGVRRTFHADRDKGLIVSSENFNDAYAADYDLGSVKAWPQYGPWPFWTVPLTMLVYHDSLIHSWWEMHSYNATYFGRTRAVGPFFEYGGGRPRLQAALDALMGCPPDVFPFGAQYGWTGEGTETFLFRYRFEDPEVQAALRQALPVARLHRRIGPCEMVHFKILSEDGYVQESAFSDGTRVVANFSRDIYGGQKGIGHAVIEGVGSLMPESWVIAE
jgi:hypothetical protein